MPERVGKLPHVPTNPPSPPYPLHDTLEPRPVDYVAIEFAPGTEANAYGHPGSLLWPDTSDAGTSIDLPGDPQGIHRSDEPITIISRRPERP